MIEETVVTMADNQRTGSQSEGYTGAKSNGYSEGSLCAQAVYDRTLSSHIPYPSPNPDPRAMCTMISSRRVVVPAAVFSKGYA